MTGNKNNLCALRVVKYKYNYSSMWRNTNEKKKKKTHILFEHLANCQAFEREELTL